MCWQATERSRAHVKVVVSDPLRGTEPKSHLGRPIDGISDGAHVRETRRAQISISNGMQDLWKLQGRWPPNPPTPVPNRLLLEPFPLMGIDLTCMLVYECM